MKKITVLFVSILSLALVMIVAIQAAEFDLVADGVGVLTDAEYVELNELAQDITDQYQCEVSIIIIENTENKEITEFTKTFYQEYDYGYGEDKSGLMLLINMEERDYALVTYGDGNMAFTDSGKDVLGQKYLLPMLKKDEYFPAFSMYLRKTDEFLKRAQEGKPIGASESENSQDSPWIKLAILMIVPLLIAGGVCFIFLGQMKTAVPQRAADSYIPDGGFNLTREADEFMYRTENRTRIENKSASGGSSSKKGKF